MRLQFSAKIVFHPYIKSTPCGFKMTLFFFHTALSENLAYLCPPSFQFIKAYFKEVVKCNIWWWRSNNLWWKQKDTISAQLEITFFIWMAGTFINSFKLFTLKKGVSCLQFDGTYNMCKLNGEYIHLQSLEVRISFR